MKTKINKYSKKFIFILIALLVISLNIVSQTIVSDTSELILPLDIDNYTQRLPQDKFIFLINNNLSSCNPEVQPVYNMNNWQQMYFDANQGAINGPLFPNLDYVLNNARESVLDNIYQIGILHLLYLTLKDEAFEKGLIYFGEEEEEPYIDPSATSLDLCELEESFAAAVLEEKALPEDVQFIISDDFYFTNTSETIDYFEIDFDDGFGTRKVCINEMIMINYKTLGKKLIKLTPAFIDKSKSTFKSINIEIEVSTIIEKAPSDYSYYGNDFESTITDFSYTNTGHHDDINGKKGKAEVKIWCNEPGSANTLEYFDRPLVIIDGFDPAPQKRNCDDLYDDAQEWNNTIDVLKAECYDIVTVNWVGGGDWIQKNAFALIEVLNFINENKVGFNDIVLVCPSMGGLIGRYALSYMEQHNMEHHVGTFITDDSPHRGANIPFGLQYHVSFFYNKSHSARISHRQLTCPASRQLLLHYFSTSQHSLRTEFINELHSLGDYPQKPKKIAIASGSGIGESQRNDDGDVLDPGDEIYFMYCKKDIIGTVAWGYFWAVPDENDPETKIYKGRKILSIIVMPFILPIQVIIKFIDLEGFAQHTKPYDNCPGGYYPEYEALTVENNTECDMSIYLYFPYFTFIPTISALDLDHSITDLYYTDFDVNDTPFDEIKFTKEPVNEMPPRQYAYNEKHCFITQEKQDAMLNFLGNGYPEDILIQNENLFSPVRTIPTYIQSNNSISAGSDIDPGQTQGNVIIKTGCEVYFSATNTVLFKPGFAIENGATFNAEIRSPIYLCESKGKSTVAYINEETNTYNYTEIDDFINKKVKTSENNRINIYPNPNNGNFTIAINGYSTEPVNYEVVNLMGSVIFNGVNVENSKTNINISNQPKGIYFIRVRVGAQVFTEKIIHQ